MLAPIPCLQTERLTLTPLRIEHAPQIFTLLSDPQHTRYLSFPTATDLQSVADETEAMLNQSGNCLWLIRDRAADFAGICGFLGDSANPNLIYSVAETKQGCGYCTEACRAVLAALAQVRAPIAVGPRGDFDTVLLLTSNAIIFCSCYANSICLKY